MNIAFLASLLAGPLALSLPTPAQTTVLAPPQILEYGSAEALYFVDTPIPENRPQVFGRVASWSVTPALPAGLELDEATGVLRGTPESPTPTAEYVVAASNTSGTDRFPLRLTVEFYHCQTGATQAVNTGKVTGHNQ